MHPKSSNPISTGVVLANANSQSTSTLQDVHIITMALPIEALTMLDEPEHIDTWIRYFTELARVKKLKDEKASRREKKITYLFLAMVGHEKNINNGLP